MKKWIILILLIMPKVILMSYNAHAQTITAPTLSECQDKLEVAPEAEILPDKGKLLQKFDSAGGQFIRYRGFTNPSQPTEESSENLMIYDYTGDHKPDFIQYNKQLSGNTVATAYLWRGPSFLKTGLNKLEEFAAKLDKNDYGFVEKAPPMVKVVVTSSLAQKQLFEDLDVIIPQTYAEVAKGHNVEIADIKFAEDIQPLVASAMRGVNTFLQDRRKLCSNGIMFMQYPVTIPGEKNALFLNGD